VRLVLLARIEGSQVCPELGSPPIAAGSGDSRPGPVSREWPQAIADHLARASSWRARASGAPRPKRGAGSAVAAKPPLTRRRQDAPSLPRRKVTVRTTGQVYTAPDGKAYRPSMFLTLTCDSYGKVRDDGTPADPRRSAPGHRVSQVTKPSRYRLLALLGGGLGLRQGEALSLAVNRVDAAAGMVRVDQQVVLISRRPVLAPPNTMASVRYVPLPRFVADAIMQQVAAFDLELDEVLCRTPRGNLLRRDYYNAEIWRPAILAAGLPADTTFHDLRHTFALLLFLLLPRTHYLGIGAVRRGASAMAG
jgi:integrase